MDLHECALARALLMMEAQGLPGLVFGVRLHENNRKSSKTNALCFPGFTAFISIDIFGSI